ncbi:MAG: hypothetical protein AAFZ18_39325 [Myxococcota bacterium]
MSNQREDEKAVMALINQGQGADFWISSKDLMIAKMTEKELDEELLAVGDLSQTIGRLAREAASRAHGRSREPSRPRNEIVDGREAKPEPARSGPPEDGPTDPVTLHRRRK